MDNGHEVNLGTTLRYEYCPPASGLHFNASGRGPIKRDFYGPDSETNPGGWVHNLEHGYIVTAYSCRNGCPTSEELAALRTWMDSLPSTPSAEACRVPNKGMVVRFDAMSTKYATLSWDRAMLMDQWDAAAATEFFNQRVESPPAPEATSC